VTARGAAADDRGDGERDGSHEHDRAAWRDLALQERDDEPHDRR
jgi:hypothetical protein